MRWRFTSGGRGSRPAPAGKSISQAASGDWSPGCMAGFFGVFLAAGLGFALIFLLPLVKVIKAQSWTAVDCEILSSTVESHPGDDSTTYSVEVTYRYAFDGVEYRGDRYEFMGGSSSGYKSKQRRVDAMPQGSLVTCYVDPEEPQESVVHRGLSWVYLFAILPLVFVAIGGAGVSWALVSMLRQRRASRDPMAAMLQAEQETSAFREVESWSPPLETGPIELEETLSPAGKLGCLVVAALFWNGIVSVFVWQLWSQWRSGGGLDGCLTAFLVPFVLVGLGLLVGIPYQILALANPRPKLTLSRSSIPIGGSAQLSWSFTGSTGRLRDLKITIEGAEKATYRRGTTTHTDTEVFATLDVVEVAQGMPLATGNATVRIPRDTMHSFEATRNKIVWTLKLHASIAHWPDVITEFPLEVAPGDGEYR